MTLQLMPSQTTLNHHLLWSDRKRQTDRPQCEVKGGEEERGGWFGLYQYCMRWASRWCIPISGSSCHVSVMQPVPKSRTLTSPLNCAALTDHVLSNVRHWKNMCPSRACMDSKEDKSERLWPVTFQSFHVSSQDLCQLDALKSWELQICKFTNHADDCPISVNTQLIGELLHRGHCDIVIVLLSGRATCNWEGWNNRSSNWSYRVSTWMAAAYIRSTLHGQATTEARTGARTQTLKRS